MKAARLRPCDLSVCEGMCCHDGAWLLPGEVQPLRRLVFKRRAELPGLPDRFLVPVGNGAYKTTTRPHTFRVASLPAHFTPTRCVFCLPDARCALQVLAEADGVHKWAYKPRACWMHPLRDGPDGPLPPPADPADDWDRAPGYPGFLTFTECGRDRPDGEDWATALAEERTFLATHPLPEP